MRRFALVYLTFVAGSFPAMPGTQCNLLIEERDYDRGLEAAFRIDGEALIGFLGHWDQAVAIAWDKYRQRPGKRSYSVAYEDSQVAIYYYEPCAKCAEFLLCDKTKLELRDPAEGKGISCQRLRKLIASGKPGGKALVNSCRK